MLSSSEPDPSRSSIHLESDDSRGKSSRPNAMVAQLPTELLQLIFQHATQESLRQCRLVDRQWSAASTPYVFERFHASLFSRSMTKLSALSQSSLAKHVKAIDFHTDQLPRYAKGEWQSMIDSRPNISSYGAGLEANVDRSQTTNLYDKLPRHHYTPEQLEKGWQAFEAYSREQERWDMDVALKVCMGRLQNLREVVADRAKPFGGPVNNQPYWRNFMSEILVGPDAWTYDQDMPNDLEAFSALLLATAVGYRSSIAGTRAVEKLVLDLPTDYSFYDMVHLPPHSKLRLVGYPLTEEPDARYETLLNAFRPLKHLALRCPSIEDPERPACQSQMRETEQVLAAASGLRSLGLDFGEPGRSYEGSAELEHRFDYGLMPLLSRTTITYEHLKNLVISASFPSKCFISFLVLHKDTLKTLDILDCFCDDWKVVLETVAKELELDHVYVESLWSPEPADDIEDEGPGLLLGEGLDADDEFTQDMKYFLYTGKGSMPVMDDYEVSESDEEDDEQLEEVYYVDDNGEYHFFDM